MQIDNISKQNTELGGEALIFLKLTLQNIVLNIREFF